MLEISNVEVVGWEHAIRGMRNPMNSWDKSDSVWVDFEYCDSCQISDGMGNAYIIGDNDLSLMKKLSKAGTDHRKFMRMIVVYADINAPMYWWKEFDTYKVGTVRNSCSTMHKIHSEPISPKDFSFDWIDCNEYITWCESLRREYLRTNDKKYWRVLIQMLPSSYNQKSTVMLNYEVLENMYHSRKAHKLDEWREFCKWIESLPYSELITGESKK